MYHRITLKDHPEVKRVILAAFPNYKKRECVVNQFGEHGKSINSYWDGGSRSEYAIVELSTLTRKSLPTSTHPFFEVQSRGMANKENEVVSVDRVGNITLKILPDGYALVECGIFCGKPATARIYLNSANLTKFLPATSTPEDVNQNA